MSNLSAILTQDRDHNKNRLAGLIHLQDRLMDKIAFYAEDHKIAVGPVTAYSVPEGFGRLIFTYKAHNYQILIDEQAPHFKRIESIVKNMDLNDATIQQLEQKTRRERK